MTTRDDSDFWRNVENAAPGLFNFGAGMYSRNQAQNESAARLKTAQGPLYDASMAAAGGALNMAGKLDPKAHATERFNAAQGMLAGTDAASMDDLMRRLHASGQGGIASFSGAEGGPAMNPQMAAYFEAKADRDSKMAYDSLRQGEAYMDNMLKRSGMLQQQAANTQAAGLNAQRTQPSKAAGTAQMLKGFGGLLKDTGALNKIPGMIRGGIDWLRGGSAAPAVDFGDWGGQTAGFNDWLDWS